MKKKIKKNKEQTTFDPKTMTKTPGGHGYGMKRNYKPTKEEMSGRNLASVFGWKLND